MKRFLLFITVFVIGTAIESAKGQTASITQGCAPLTVSFTAPSGSGPSHFWDFNDGATATLQNPQNTFTTPGNYTVEYHASSSGPVIGTVTINVYEQPVPEYTASPETGCPPLNVSFQNTTQLEAGITINSYSWVFGDGGNASGASPNHVFTTAGSFYVSLEIETNMPSCDVTEFYNNAIVVTPGPTVNFTTTPNPATVCDPPLTVSFTNNSTSPNPLTFEWDFGNGNTSTDQNPASQTYTQNGNYIVTLTGTDPSGCAGTFQRPVNVGSPTTAFIIPDTICLGATVVMDNQSSPGSYGWSFAVGNVPVASNQPEPQVTFNTPGLQNVTLTTNAGQCSSSSTVQIFVEDPTAEFTSLPDHACSQPMDVQFTPVNGGYAEYQWLFGDSTTSSDVNPLHTYFFPDTFEYSWNGLDTLVTQLIVISSAGCRDTASFVDTLWMPNAVFFPDVADGCVPLTVTFSDSSTSKEDIVSWEWHLGDGTVINATTGDPQTVTYTQVGHYATYLVIENAAGCTDTSYSVITTVGDELTPDFTADVSEVCPGDPVQFTNQTAMSDSVDYWHYYSETNRQFHCFDDPNPTWNYTNEVGLMDVTLMVGWNGCYSTTTISDLINVKGPIAKIHLNCECDAPYDVDFTNESLDFTSVSWQLGDGNSNTSDIFTHTYAATGDYTVVLMAENSSSGCPASYDTLTVKIRDIQASFTADSIQCRGQAAPFNATASQDVFSDCWGGFTYQFSDPTKRPITTPNANQPISFNNLGPVDVTLIVRDENGCKDTAQASFHVSGIDAAFSMSDNHICTPFDVDFTDLSTSDTAVTDWFWSFGDFGISTDQNPTHTYTLNQPSVDILFIASNEVGCIDTAESTITMYNPFSNIGSTPGIPNICVGQTVNFSATDYTAGGSNLSFDWDFMDGGQSQIQNPSHQFNQSGQFIVELSYTEIATGCGGTTTTTVNVQDYPIAGFMQDDSSTVICTPGSANFIDTTISSGFYSSAWNFGNGSTSTDLNPSAAYPNGGTYDVRLIVTTTYGCRDTAIVTYVGANPEGSFTMDQNTICRGEEITFTLTDTSEVTEFYWDFGDGNSIENVSPVSHTYTFVPPNGETVGKLVVSGPNGRCPDQASLPIYIHEVVADFIRNDGIDTALCFQPFSITNTSLNSDVFYWDFGFGSPSTIEDPGMVEFPAPGDYEVTLGVLNNNLGCNDTITKTVRLHPIPVVLSKGDTICEGNTGQLEVLNPDLTSNYTWTSSEIVADVNAVSTTSSPLLTANYEIMVLDTNGCSDVDTAIIFVINPLVLSDWDTTIVIGDSVCMPIDAEAGLYIFDWNPTEGLDCDTCGSPCLQPLEKVTYSVSVTDILGCFTANADYTVDIYPETFLSMPTTFTPNDDGHNDVITVEGWGIKELVEFRIFNRWGEEVFFTNNEEEGWDGYFKGVLQNNDVYAYKIKATTWRDETKTLEGYINLLR